MEFKLIEKLDELSKLYNDDLRMIKDLVIECSKYFNKEQIELIIKAYKCANDLHRGQKRKSGEPYIIHPIRVAHIALEEMHLLDAAAICAALLHDTEEDTGITEEELAKLFTDEIAYLVTGVTKIKNLDSMDKSEEELYNDCILLRSCAKDIRVIMIKIADRLHNMRTLIYKGDKSAIAAYLNSKAPIEELKIVPNAKQIEKSAETLSLFVPLAELIGAHNIATELANISYMYLENSLFREINGNIKNFEREHINEIETILENLAELLNKANIAHDLRAKTKSFYEVNAYLKSMEMPSARVSEVPGLLSFEINVDSEEECYKVEELLKKRYENKKQTFKDYIIKPKSNGYRALHILVEGISDHSIEFRICTKRMKLINDYGIAALTELYPKKSMKTIQKSLKKSNAFVKSLQSINGLYNKDNIRFFEKIREELLSGQITITTAKGDNYSIPINSTVLDLAFRIHTMLGHQAIGAIVNGIEVPNSFVLNEGDSVTILTNRGQLCQDSTSLDYVLTAYAQKEIKRALRRK